jgi:DME family drug/metabolite transporter
MLRETFVACQTPDSDHMLKSRLLLLLAACLWSTAGAAMKLCQLSGVQIAGGRSLVAGLFLFLLVPEARRKPSWLVFHTAVAYAATVGLFAISNKLTTAANAIFLQSTAPLWVLMLSARWLGERPTRPELLAMPIYGLGLSLFFLDELSPGQRAGNLVAVAAGVAFAMCIVGLRRLSRSAEIQSSAPGSSEASTHGAGASALVLGNGLAALCAAPFWYGGPIARPIDLGILVYLGVFQLGLAYLCFVRGVGGTRALEASLLVLLEPVLNPIWAFLFAGERPGPWALAGGSIVLGATVWRIVAPVVAARWGRIDPGIPRAAG